MKESKNEYTANPCAASSLPFWKTAGISIPENMLVVRDDMLSPEMLHGCKDEPYFKMCHDLNHIKRKAIPAGFNLIPATTSDFSQHIEECYAQERASAEELLAYQKRPTYHPDLWIALADNVTGRIAASGIAEYDAEIGEGILEWIQVSPAYRRRGLGVAQLAKCIREGGEPLASGRMACHVLDIVEKIMESGRSGRVCTTETACERPAAFENWKELLK